MHPVSIVNTALSSAVNVWARLVEATGMWSYYMSGIVMLLLLRFLLLPIFGSTLHYSPGRSDSAKRKNNRRKKEDNDG